MNWFEKAYLVPDEGIPHETIKICEEFLYKNSIPYTTAKTERLNKPIGGRFFDFDSLFFVAVGTKDLSKGVLRRIHMAQKTKMPVYMLYLRQYDNSIQIYNFSIEGSRVNFGTRCTEIVLFHYNEMVDEWKQNRKKGYSYEKKGVLPDHIKDYPLLPDECFLKEEKDIEKITLVSNKPIIKKYDTRRNRYLTRNRYKEIISNIDHFEPTWCEKNNFLSQSRHQKKFGIKGIVQQEKDTSENPIVWKSLTKRNTRRSKKHTKSFWHSLPTIDDNFLDMGDFKKYANEYLQNKLTSIPYYSDFGIDIQRKGSIRKKDLDNIGKNKPIEKYTL